MSSKSGQSRRERLARSKRNKGRQSPPVKVAQQQAAAPIQETTALPGISAPPSASTSPVSAPVPEAVAAPVRYPYVVSELRRIGILAGIILVILVILAVTLP